ncbi:MAG: hypothetical protein CL666_09845 [Balneola sp.]|nr:hypothetical protein [Balneola sp.]|tara:strand:- start:38117 stop:38548 length:432 start_codon:yes stop_codon:yes gene_type:complete
MWQELIFLTNTFTSFFMMGLIWLVQLVHYPSFRFVSEQNYLDFQNHHVHSIDKIVIPIMIIEITTSFALSWYEGFLSLNALGFLIVLMIWISTGLFSVPAHSKLESGKDLEAINKLVSTNWIRTILWTLKSGLSFYLLMKMLG